MIIDPGDQIRVSFSVPVAFEDVEITEFWIERNCSFYIKSDSSLWRDQRDGDCVAVFHTSATLVMTVNMFVSASVMEGGEIQFDGGVLKRANSLFSETISATHTLTRGETTSPGTLVISTPESLNSCGDLIIDLSTIGNLAGKPLSNISIAYFATADTSDTSLKAYLNVTMQDYLKGGLSITVPSSLITSRSYNFTVNASSIAASALSEFTVARIPAPNFPTVSISSPTGEIDSSVMYILYATVDDPCPSISNPILLFKWMDSNGTVLSTSANLVISPYQLAIDSTNTFTLECYYLSFLIVPSEVVVVSAKEVLRVSTGGDQVLGVRSGIQLIGQFSSNLKIVEYVNYRFVTVINE